MKTKYCPCFYKENCRLDFNHSMNINRNTNFYLKVKKKNEPEMIRIWLHYGIMAQTGV